MCLQSSEVNEIKYRWKFTVFKHAKLNAMVKEVTAGFLEVVQQT